ncbi:MAG: hypothetical protein ABIS50_19125 [Luteolibacter sp.]|uniref:hypothetical protein n=1 Tax=Luteolibacter sp. TaxID=1962973 RepID=UPI003265CAA7
MLFPVTLLPMLLIVMFASGISTWLFNLFSSSKIRETQTRFAIAQIAERIDEIEAAQFPRTTEDLIDTLRLSKIDWNSCGIQGERILDGWGRPIRTTFDQVGKRWAFRSPGKDGKIGTADDIERSTNRN